MTDTAERPERVFLVGLRTERQSDAQAQEMLAELAELGRSLGALEVGRSLCRVREGNSAYLLGSGKADEIVAQAKELGADSIVFDQILSPSQQRNWEDLSSLSIYDRQETIIRIFRLRARTKEASLQAELAALEYSLPRLTHSREALGRQRGGSYGTRGSGEQKLELDRRVIKERIKRIQQDLKQVRQDRSTMRQRRQGAFNCSLLGYTNAGKTSLLNALSGSQQKAENQLFCTLDPCTKRVFSPGLGREIPFTDTVGFIRQLPHGLIDAFRSTLEEASLADLILLVLDSSDPWLADKLRACLGVLKELGADSRPMLLVLNKADLLTEESKANLIELYPKAVIVSSMVPESLKRLMSAVEEIALESAATQRVQGDNGV